MKYTHALYNLIHPDWTVLAVGCGSQPFRRADCVIDNVPYRQREVGNAAMKNLPEYFTEDTWYEQDLSQTPWPFEDGEFDFVVVDHSIVSTRDPIAICYELQRVADRGYIETPSVYMELLKGVDSEGLVGFRMSRWLVDEHEGHLRFVAKPSLVQSKQDFIIDNPGVSHFPYLNPKYAVSGFFWEDYFEPFEDLEAASFPDWYLEEYVWQFGELANPENNKQLWAIDDNVPVILEKSPFITGLIKTMTEQKANFAIPLVSNTNQPNPEMLKLEQLLKKKMLGQIDDQNS